MVYIQYVINSENTKVYMPERMIDTSTTSGYAWSQAFACFLLRTVLFVHVRGTLRYVPDTVSGIFYAKRGQEIAIVGVKNRSHRSSSRIVKKMGHKAFAVNSSGLRFFLLQW